MTTQLPIRELSASEITATALVLLKYRRVTAWRQNNLATHGRKNTVTPGIPDILGYNRDTAVLVGCEVKKMGDYLSKEQKAFLENLSNCGGIALVACQIGNQVELVPYLDYIKKKASKPKSI